MNLNDYTVLLSKPESVNDKQTQALEAIVTEFPFFQSARALRLKGLYNQSSFQYNYALKVTAAYTTDRSVLFDFITSDTFTAIHKGLYEQKLAELYGIEVKGSELVTKIGLPETMLDKVEQSILTSIRESEMPFEQPAAIEVEKDAAPEIAAPETFRPEVNQPETTMSIDGAVADEENSPEPDNSIIAIPEALKTTEEKLEIGKPLAFSKDEKHSFQEWLQLAKIQPIARAEDDFGNHSTSELERDRMKKKDLIDQFIKANPKIPPIRQDAKSQPVAEPFREDTTALMTETLARVYLEQKKYQKAIQAYEILILKYPEKITFFADRISEVKNLQHNNI